MLRSSYTVVCETVTLPHLFLVSRFGSELSLIRELYKHVQSSRLRQVTASRRREDRLTSVFFFHSAFDKVKHMLPSVLVLGGTLYLHGLCTYHTGLDITRSRLQGNTKYVDRSTEYIIVHFYLYI